MFAWLRQHLSPEESEDLALHLRGSRWYVPFYRGIGGTRADMLQISRDLRKHTYTHLQPTEDIDRLYALARNAEPEFVQKLQRLGLPFDQAHMFKNQERVVEKLHEYPDGSPRNITDILRTRIVCPTIDECRVVLDRMFGIFDIVYIKDTTDKINGYRSINVRVRLRGKFIAEIQLIDACTLRVSKLEHKDYEIRRTGGQGEDKDWFKECYA